MRILELRIIKVITFALEVIFLFSCFTYQLCIHIHSGSEKNV